MRAVKLARKNTNNCTRTWNEEFIGAIWHDPNRKDPEFGEQFAELEAGICQELLSNERAMQITDIQPEDIDRQTEATKARYNRIAPVSDLVEWFTERSTFQEWRRDLWSRLPTGRILEVGVGTGKNMPYYPKGAQVTAIDLSEGMLEKAKQRAEDLGIDLDLRHMDVQHLAFPEDTFEAAVARY